MQMLKQMPQHIANLPKTGFEMSQSYGFTSSTGMLLPVYQDFLNPGEKIRFSGSLFSRTQPIVTAAMADVDVYLDWFFVPASMLYTLFPSLFYMTDDRLSSMYDSKDLINFPLMNIDQALSRSLSGDDMTVVSDYNVADVFMWGDCLAKARFRLADHLGFNPFGVFSQYDSKSDSPMLLYRTANPNVFPMFPLAYQAIYEKHYRIEDRENFDPRWFNVDKFASSTTFSNDAAYSPFTLRYRPRKNDYFMSNMPSPIMSGVSMLGSTSDVNRSPSAILSQIDNWLTTGVNNSFLGSNSPSPSNKFNVGEVSTSIFSGSLGDNAGSVFNTIRPLSTDISSALSIVSPANIRSIFAIEKLLRITGRAEKNYDAQVLAHFGWKVPHDVKHDISFLGSDVGVLHIGEVVSDADTYDSSANTGTALGAVGGKGYISIKGKSRSFTAPVHGVVMCIYSSVPRQRYYGGFDKQNAITSRLSFYQPEFDKLGSQPIYGYEADFQMLDSAYSSQVRPDSVYVGWQNRYSQWKRKYDKVSMAFLAPHSDTVVNQYSSWVLATMPYRNGVPFDSTISTDALYTSYASYYASPHDLDNIMVMDYSSAFDSSYLSSPWLMFATDPFINDFHADVKKVSTMSKTGEPNLD